MSGVLIAAYLAAAGIVAISAFRYGVLERPRDRLLAGRHYVVLGAVAAAVGATWIFFLPLLTFRWLRSSRQHAPSAARGWAGFARAKAPAHF